MLMANSVSSAVNDSYAYGGFISSSKINQGDRVEFSAVFNNFNSTPFYLFSFNVTFVERIGSTTTRDPNRPNITKLYESDRRQVLAGESFTETISHVVDFNPGSYNVSIFFQYGATETVTQPASLSKAYGLINQTFSVEGLTQGLEALKYIGYVLAGIVVVVIGLLVYNSKFKK